jgi:hypothetical protein
LFEHLTFHEYFSKYKVQSGMNSKNIQEASYVGNDLQGNKVYTNNCFIRFFDYHPAHHFQAFCYNLLLRRMVF